MEKSSNDNLTEAIYEVAKQIEISNKAMILDSMYLYDMIDVQELLDGYSKLMDEMNNSSTIGEMLDGRRSEETGRNVSGEFVQSDSEKGE